MSGEESGYPRWTDDRLLDEIASNLGSLEGMYSVECVDQGPYSIYQTLLRISTSNGRIIRIGISFVHNAELAEDFDASFH